MTITIIGIDPGSRLTGYGVIGLEGNHHRYITSGYLDLRAFNSAERLRQIFLGIQAILCQFEPQEAAIEQVFMHQNPSSALKLGQARGAAMVALTIPVMEYSAREIKKSVVGYGGAEKEQVQFMVKRILNLNKAPQADASDALAVALCHAHARMLRLRGLVL
jgi:crossover junction endodeoxyribonuclease RuvC